jgi:hypothetical protein
MRDDRDPALRLDARDGLRGREPRRYLLGQEQTEDVAPLRGDLLADDDLEARVQVLE